MIAMYQLSGMGLKAPDSFAMPACDPFFGSFNDCHQQIHRLKALRDQQPAFLRTTLPTGIAFGIPAGWYGRIAPRSGLANKYGADILAGVVDADFIGAVKVAMINHGDDTIELRQGDRIAQLILERCGSGALIEVSSLENTGRGTDGLGSTGR